MTDDGADLLEESYLVLPNIIDQTTFLATVRCIANICVGHPKRVIHLLLHSNGGNVTTALALYRFIRAFPNRITAYNMASVDSAAMVVFMAARTREMHPDATFQFHHISLPTPESTMTRRDVEFHSEAATRLEEQVAFLIAKETELTKEEVLALFRSSHTGVANWAKAHGVVHDASDLVFDDGTPICVVA